MGSDSDDDSRRKSRKMSDDDKSRSKSRSRSRSRSRGGGNNNGRLTKVVDIAKDDAAFVLGRGGATKRKIARVSGADIELDEHALTITLNGTESQCNHAIDYIDFIKQQRVGPVTIDTERSRGDYTAYTVPGDCIGFVMGRNGQTLRSMEEEWGVLMFFAKTGKDGGESRRGDDEQLCIFGPLAARRGAELKTMSAVEHKHPGYCVSSKGELRDVDRVPGDDDEGGWGIDTVPLTDDSFSYALGARGSTRRKLAAASGCIIEYVGRLACFAGYRQDRRRGKDYLRWLLEQRTGQSVVDDPRSRDDCTIVKVPSKSVGFLTGYRGESLRAIEREAGTFMFTDGSGRDGPEENLLIFSFSRRNRDHAAEIVQDRVRHHERVGDRPPMDRGGGYGGPPMGGGGYGGPPMRDNMCWDFQKGRCTRGAMCRFSHGEPPMGGGGYNQGYGGGRGRSRSRSRDRNRDRGRRRRDDSSSRSRSRGRRRRRD
ncbi:unnamed protein product [Pelagomonas calceolata]|uniref:C3H1-type domain-containing protein n=1 Tax=Pelagomonas calceolata TaxID=35677 RepID=A0A8J2SZT3_9STRA|nr:unnamed protein product [Pelagomonas calceolata]